MAPSSFNTLKSLIRAPGGKTSLPHDYTPTDFDVCSGRGKKNWNLPGNVYFRNLIQANVQRYIDAPAKSDKTEVVNSLVREIREQGGLFLKQDAFGCWYDIGDALARDKVGHSLRDQVTGIKKQAREAAQQEQHRPMFKQAKQQMQMKLRETDDDAYMSDTEADITLRRSSLLASTIIDAFTRRPSMLGGSIGTIRSIDGSFRNSEIASSANWGKGTATADVTSSLNWGKDLSVTGPPENFSRSIFGKSFTCDPVLEDFQFDDVQMQDIVESVAI